MVAWDWRNNDEISETCHHPVIGSLTRSTRYWPGCRLLTLQRSYAGQHTGQRRVKGSRLIIISKQWFLHSPSLSLMVQESSAKLTNQRVSYAFTSSPFSFHARHSLPTSKFQHSYSCILLIFFKHQWTAWWVRTECEYSSLVWHSRSFIPLNNSITLISLVQSPVGLHFLPLTVYT